MRIQFSSAWLRRLWTRLKIQRIIFVLIAGIALYYSVYFEPLDRHLAQENQQTFQQVEFARDFWSNQLLRNLGKAVSAEILLNLFEEDMQAAVNQYGQTLGISTRHSYLLQGQGTILAVDETNVVISLGEPPDSPDVIIEIRDVFGNAVRDASGLLDVSDFQSTMEFNSVSVEINRIILEEVIPEIKEQADIGRTIRFVGAAEVSETDLQPRPLRIIPIQIQIENHQPL